MAKKWVLYDGQRQMMYPSGEMADPARMIRDFPAMAVFPYIILTDESEQVCWAVENFAAARDNAGIDPEVSDEQALEMLSARENAEPGPAPVSAEERIAAALEFQSMMMLEDTEVEA